MELTATQKDFLETNHNAVCTTFRRNGAAQLSIVTSGLYGGGAAFTTTADRAKHRNLARDPRCTLLVSHENWRPFLVLEGNATVLSQDNTPAEELRTAFRDVFRAAAGKDAIGDEFGLAPSVGSEPALVGSRVSMKDIYDRISAVCLAVVAGRQVDRYFRRC